MFLRNQNDAPAGAQFRGGFTRRALATVLPVAACLAGLAAGATLSLAGDTPAPAPTWRTDPSVTRPCDRLPRKVIVGTEISGYDVILTFPLEMRLQRMDELVDAMAAQTEVTYPGKRLDLAVLTEYFLTRTGRTAEDLAVSLEEVRPRMAACAKKHGCYLIVPLVMKEEGTPVRYSNVAVLMDRDGQVAGMYRKVHVAGNLRGVDLEGGITPGRDYPVFNCDFGRVGIQICYDIFYPEGWDALAKQGAEIVALASETPETVRPSAYAVQHRYYIVSATPRDHAAVFNPLGMIEDQATQAGVMVHQIDLSYEIEKWESGLDGGRGPARKFGDKIGYYYYGDQDHGIFWSNDPNTTIGQMMGSLGFPNVDDETQYMRALNDKLRGGLPVVP
jgi:predicted amidohydrolase